jgi:hypothetical protein
MKQIFSHINELAVIVFIFSTLAVTQGLKFIFAKKEKFCLLIEIGFFRILLSWGIGAIMFFVLALVLHDFPVTEFSIIQYAIWTLLLNGGYKVVISFLEMLKKIRSKA